MSQRGNHGSFLPTTQVWDVSEIYQTDVTSPQFKELLVRLYQNLNQQALVTNGKDTGIYHTEEFVSGQVFFSDPLLDSSTPDRAVQRQGLRKVINFGALPNTSTKSVKHNITLQESVTFTRIYGTSSDTTNKLYIPLPYSSSTLINNIELWVEGDYVKITTAADWSACTKTYVVLEFLKN